MASEYSTSWDDLVEFYCELIEKYGWQQQPMLEYVNWLASGQYACELFPSSSHEALGLSAYPTYAERMNKPMVYIVYYDSKKHFEIHWQQGQGKSIRKEIIESPQTQEIMARILSWLGVVLPNNPTKSVL